MPKKQDLNFLPEDYMERRVEARTNLICLVLFVLVMAGVGGAYFITDGERSEVRKLQQEVNASYTEAAKRLEQLNELQRKKDAMLRKAQTTGTLLELVPRSFLLADLINRMPQNMSVFDFSLATKVKRMPIVNMNKTKSALKNAKKAAGQGDNEPNKPAPPSTIVTLSLTGVAPTDVDVAKYMANLANSSLLREVNLVYSEEKLIEDATLRRFRIDMELSPSADVRQLEPLRVKRVGSDSNVGISGGGADAKDSRAIEKALDEKSAQQNSEDGNWKSLFGRMLNQRRKNVKPEPDVADAVND